MNLNKNDLKQLKVRNLKEKEIELQLNDLKENKCFVKLYSYANVDNGVKQFDQSDIEKYLSKYTEFTKKKSIASFIPASGAATRMFSKLLNFMEEYDGSEEKYSEFLMDKSFESCCNFFEHIKEFAFYDDLKKYCIKHKKNLDELISKGKYKDVLEILLGEKGLNYMNKAKGLVKFHKYSNYSCSAVEEYIAESSQIFIDRGIVKIHFSIAYHAKKDFYELAKKAKKRYEKEFKTKIKVYFSYQKKDTELIAIDQNGEIVRDNNGEILFRPGGHGALIKNLNEIEDDIVFIKNIDNITTDIGRHTTIVYTKILISLLLDFQNRIFEYIKKIKDAKKNPPSYLIDEVIDFIENDLKIIDSNLSKKNVSQKSDFILKILDRPLRVCGVVKNEGEQGGGPFFVEKQNIISPQIVEIAQINKLDKQQNKILEDATYFNPVFIACGIRNYKDKKFNLTEYIDKDSKIITKKIFDGKEINVLELPGLWNGAMANWNTIFAEVPMEVFNPVKVVNDLLKVEHSALFRKEY